RRVAAQRALRIALMMVAMMMRIGRLVMRLLVPVLGFGGCSRHDECKAESDGDEPFGHDHLKFMSGEGGPPIRACADVDRWAIQFCGKGSDYAMVMSLLIRVRSNERMHATYSGIPLIGFS